MGSDRDIARQKSQPIGIAGRLDPQFGDPAQQGLSGIQPRIAPVAGDNEPIYQIMLVGVMHHVAQHVQWLVLIDRPWVLLHEGRAWLAPEEFTGIRSGHLLQKSLSVDKAQPPAIIGNGQSRQFRMSTEDPGDFIVELTAVQTGCHERYM